MQSDTSSKNYPLNWSLGFRTFSSRQLLRYYLTVKQLSAVSRQYQSIFGHSFGIQMVDPSLICFEILKAMVIWFDTIMTPIVVAGENVHDLYHNGQGVHVFVASKYASPMIHNCFQSKDMTQDFVCSLTIKSTQQALTKPLAVHHLKMVLLLMYLKWQATKAFGQDIFCLLVSNYFARRVPSIHNTDSYLCSWSSLPLLVYLESYLS